MAAFFIADVHVHDLKAYRESGYLDAARRSAARFGGEYIARGGETTVFEGDWEPGRVVIIRFPSMEQLRAWYDSDEYRPWREVRWSLADARIIALEGIPS